FIHIVRLLLFSSLAIPMTSPIWLRSAFDLGRKTALLPIPPFMALSMGLRKPLVHRLSRGTLWLTDGAAIDRSSAAFGQIPGRSRTQTHRVSTPDSSTPGSERPRDKHRPLH